MRAAFPDMTADVRHVHAIMLIVGSFGQALCVDRSSAQPEFGSTKKVMN